MNLRIFIPIITLCFFITSCGEDFLNLTPVSDASSSSFYTKSSDINQAVNGAYDALQSGSQYGRNFYLIMEVSSDNTSQTSTTDGGGIYADFDLFSVVSSNAILDQSWRSCYIGILRANAVIENIENVQMDENEKKNRMGEAKFIRALTYFNLVRIWGDVPLALKEFDNPFESFELGRESASKIYEQIIADLNDAINALPTHYVNSNDIGRATRIAAQTLLGKVYLTLKDYTQAASVLGQVIQFAESNPQQLGLMENFSDIFEVNNENGKESIFEIQYLKGGFGEGNSLINFFSPVGTSSYTNGQGSAMGENAPTKLLYSKYADGDVRRDETIGTHNSTVYFPKKYLTRDYPVESGDAGINFKVLRYADVLLMYAEALNEITYDNDASKPMWKYLNQVRERAKVNKYTPEILRNQSAFRLAIENERQLELATENHRWFDLVRTGRVIEVMNAAGFQMKTHQSIFPIPVSQINTNPEKIKQNPNYD